MLEFVTWRSGRYHEVKSIKTRTKKKENLNLRIWLMTLMNGLNGDCNKQQKIIIKTLSNKNDKKKKDRGQRSGEKLTTTKNMHLITKRHYPVHESLRPRVVMLNQLAGSPLSTHIGFPIGNRHGHSLTGTSFRQDLLEDFLTSLCPREPIATRATSFPSCWRGKP